MGQLDKYDIFQELCKYYPPPVGYKKIRVNLVYDVNNYRLHKSRLVAYGHLTDIPVESVYSWVVNLHVIHLLVFLSELN